MDTATLAKQAHDTGWNQGTVDACNAIMAWLNRTTFHPGDHLPTVMLAAWNNGDISLAAIEPQPSPTLEPKPILDPQLDFGAAKLQGYTGNECQTCHSLRMRVSGHCEVCEECGNSSGCS